MTRFFLHALVLLLTFAAALPAHAQVAFRAASSATAAGIAPAFRAAASATTTGTTLTITKPTGTAANDVLIASIGVTPSTATITPPSGWTLVRRTNNTSTTSNALAVYSKVAGGSEPASYAWTLSGSSFTVGGVQGFTGVNTAGPIDAEFGQTTASSTTHATPAITTSVANTMLVTSHVYASSSTWTPPSGMTEAFDRANGAASATGITIEGNFVLQAVAGSTGTKTATAAANADAGTTHILALKSNGVNLTINKPTGVVANDVLIAGVAFSNSSAVITPPSGWTLVRRTNNTATTSNALAVYSKVAGASEPASYAWNIAGGAFLVGGIQAFSGADTTTSIDVENGQTTASSLTHATPSVTTTQANTMLVTTHAFASASSWTPPSGMTESFDIASGAPSATGMTIEGSRVLQAAAGATGAKSATAAANANVGNTHILALRRLNIAPTVNLTNPAAGATFSPPASVTLTANATDTDGTIAKVEFFQGSTLIGTVTSAPYTFNWTSVLTGSYNLTAKATDNLGAATTSSPVAITVDTAPGISLTSPVANSNFTPPASITLTATASDTDGTIAKVEFFQGSTLIGTVTSAPYTFNWTGVLTGSYSLTARATDNLGLVTTSSATAITVDTPPVVSLTSPANGANFSPPTSVTLTANATDADGTIAKVEFFQGSTLIGTVTSAPYAISWGPTTGSYSLTAKATDNLGVATTSSPIAITVDIAPGISLTSPANGATFTPPASIALTATASDTDGTIAKVEFFQGGTTLIATVTTPPYTFNWSNVPAGSYSLTAKATDNLGVATTSSPVSITVNAVPAMYFIHPDQIDTPRVITNAAQQVVWRWDNDDPFGGNVANSNPSGLGAFTFNLRFPGQYFDLETGNHYNYFRDYSPEIGRYIQSDPIGLTGGVNTYAYDSNDPLTNSDYFGLSDDSNLVVHLIAPRLTSFSGGNPWEMRVGGGGSLGGSAAPAQCKPSTGNPSNGATSAARGRTEVVQRAMSRAELAATESSGLFRGGRSDTHYASDAVNSSAGRAQQRLSLPQTPEVRVTLEVPAGRFSEPSRVAPANNMPGGGRERTATGDVPVQILRVDPY